MTVLVNSASKPHVTEPALSPILASTSNESMKVTFKNFMGTEFHVDTDTDTSVTEAMRRFVEVWSNQLQIEVFSRRNETLRQVTQSVINLAKSATPPVDINDQTIVGNVLNRIDLQLNKDTNSELSVAMKSLKNELDKSKAYPPVKFVINGETFYARYITPNNDTRKLQGIFQTKQDQTVYVIILNEEQVRTQVQEQEQANAELKASKIETTECNDDPEFIHSKLSATQQQLASTNAEEEKPNPQDKQKKECTIL